MKYLFMLTCVFVLFSCEKTNLDSIAFPAEKLDSYQFENYEESEFELPDSMEIAPENRTLFTLQSKDQKTGKKYTIYALYIGDTATIDQDSVILYCHGQSKHMDVYYDRASLLANLDQKHKYGVLMMDYRGYGRSEGTPSEMGLIEDVDVCIDFLKNHGAQEERTFYYGFSLGAIPVIDRAAYRTDFQPKKIILESPLASVEYITQTSTVLNMDADFVTTLDFDNAGKIKDVTADLLWMHGISDTYIAYENGEIIYNKYNGNYKEKRLVEDADHSEVPKVLGILKYTEVAANYLNH